MAVRTVAESITHAPAFSARGAIGLNDPPIAAGKAWAPLVPVGPVSIDRCSFERNGHRVTLVASTGDQHQVAGSRPAAAEAAAPQPSATTST